VIEANAQEAAWRALEAEHAFDYALVNRLFATTSDRLPDWLDADSSWALVFADDVAALYVRGDGPLAPLVADAYHLVSGGSARLGAVASHLMSDAPLRERFRVELERQAAASAENAGAHSTLATIAIVEGRLDDAERHLTRALAADPRTPRAHERLGMIALQRARPREALAHLEAERSRVSRPRGIDLRIGKAHQALGDTRRARAAYKRELALYPDSREAADSLRALAARGGR
jgi:tetratricopeptide (TPR) repeat protein